MKMLQIPKGFHGKEAFLCHFLFTGVPLFLIHLDDVDYSISRMVFSQIKFMEDIWCKRLFGYLHY